MVNIPLHSTNQNITLIELYDVLNKMSDENRQLRLKEIRGRIDIIREEAFKRKLNFYHVKDPQENEQELKKLKTEIKDLIKEEQILNNFPEAKNDLITLANIQSELIQQRNARLGNDEQLLEEYKEISKKLSLISELNRRISMLKAEKESTISKYPKIVIAIDQQILILERDKRQLGDPKRLQDKLYEMIEKKNRIKPKQESSEIDEQIGKCQEFAMKLLSGTKWEDIIWLLNKEVLSDKNRETSMNVTQYNDIQNLEYQEVDKPLKQDETPKRDKITELEEDHEQQETALVPMQNRASKGIFSNILNFFRRDKKTKQISLDEALSKKDKRELKRVGKLHVNAAKKQEDILGEDSPYYEYNSIYGIKAGKREKNAIIRATESISKGNDGMVKLSTRSRERLFKKGLEPKNADLRPANKPNNLHNKNGYLDDRIA